MVPLKDVAFHNAHRHVSVERKLKHWDVIDTLENTCLYDTFTWVKVKDVRKMQSITSSTEQALKLWYEFHRRPETTFGAVILGFN